MRFCIKYGVGTGIPEIDKKVYFVIRYPLRKLLLSSEVARQKSFYLKSRGIRNVFCGAARGANIVLAKYSAVRNAKLSHKFLFSIVRYNSYFHFTSFLFGRSCIKQFPSFFL